MILSVVKRRHIAEVVLNADRTTMTAKEETGDLYSAIDLAMDKIERQIRKAVTKRKAHKHPAPTPTPAQTSPARRSRGPRVTSERVAIEEMTVADAVKRLSRNSAEFLVFQNEATDVLNVLYRRKDGGYGLIEPEVG